MKTAVNIIAYLFARFFEIPFRILPYRACLFLGRVIVITLYPFAASKKKIARENIRYAFPELSEQERDELLWKHFLFLGDVAGSTLYAPRIDQTWMDKYLEYDPDSLILEQETYKEGKGFFCVSGHYGVWELMVHFMPLRYRISSVYKKIRNPYVEKWMYNVRTKNGMILIDMKEPGLVPKALKQGHIVGIAPDQNAGQAGIFVDFFNRKASTFKGLSVFTYLTGARNLLYSSNFIGNGKVRVSIRDMGTIDKKSEADKEEAIKKFTVKWTKILEEEVRKMPEQYLWIHRRWRTKPGDFPGQESV